MGKRKEFQERVVKVERPIHHFVFLIAPDGGMLGMDDDGELALYDEANDRVMWNRVPEGVKR